jgi:hypothetical protein
MDLDANDWGQMNIPLGILKNLKKRIDELKSSSISVITVSTDQQIKKEKDQGAETKDKNKANINTMNTESKSTNPYDEKINSKVDNLLNKFIPQDNYLNKKQSESKENKKIELNNNIAKEKIVEEIKINPVEVELTQILNNAKNEIGEENASSVFKDLDKILSNILESDDEKFRKLNMTSKLFTRSFLPYSNMMLFLNFVIFNI